MTIKNYKKYIEEYLPYTERLTQLAEECSELAQAALKLRRTMDDTNPTPVFPETAKASVLEECGDVLSCIEVLLTPEEIAQSAKSRIAKQERWAMRIFEARRKREENRK